mmetsp:Transcript_72551/g.190173  ORF Transcript_72551/g.190173 Transcript_72551/m.190173 type:complete len:248 (-) Transcript_72551:185-928(-)
MPRGVAQGLGLASASLASAHGAGERIPLDALLDDLLLGLQLRLDVVVALQEPLKLALPRLLLLLAPRLDALQQTAHLQLLLVQELLLQGGDLGLALRLPHRVLLRLHLVGLSLGLSRLGVLLHLGQGVLDLPQVQQVLAPPRRPRLGLHPGLLEVRHVLVAVPLRQRVLEVGRVRLELGDLAVPDLVELLELLHVGLLDAEALGQLLRAELLAPAVLLVVPQLLEACLRQLRLLILSLPLAVLPVLL